MLLRGPADQCGVTGKTKESCSSSDRSLEGFNGSVDGREVAVRLADPSLAQLTVRVLIIWGGPCCTQHITSCHISQLEIPSSSLSAGAFVSMDVHLGALPPFALSLSLSLSSWVHNQMPSAAKKKSGNNWQTFYKPTQQGQLQHSSVLSCGMSILLQYRDDARNIAETVAPSPKSESASCNHVPMKSSSS